MNRKTLATMAAQTLAGSALVVPIIVGTASAAPAGCVDAWQAPHSAAADQCRADGWTVRRRLVVSPRGWVRYNQLPHCPFEDGGENQPCTWNIGPGTDGNGLGLAYWIDRNDRSHYVRGVR